MQKEVYLLEEATIATHNLVQMKPQERIFYLDAILSGYIKVIYKKNHTTVIKVALSGSRARQRTRSEATSRAIATPPAFVRSTFVARYQPRTNTTYPDHFDPRQYPDGKY